MPIDRRRPSRPSKAMVNRAYRAAFPKGPNFCDVCDQSSKQTSLCSGCKTRRYCSQECQRTDWKSGHKTLCKIMRAESAKQQVPRLGRRVCIVGLTSKGGKKFNDFLGRIVSEPGMLDGSSDSDRFGVAIDRIKGIKNLLAVNLKVLVETEVDFDDLDVKQRSPRWAAADTGAGHPPESCRQEDEATVELFVLSGAVHGFAKKQAVRRWLYNCTFARSVRAGSGHGVDSPMQRVVALKHAVRSVLSYVRIPQTESWLMTKTRGVVSSAYGGLFVKESTFQGRSFYTSNIDNRMILCCAGGRWCVTTREGMLKANRRTRAMEMKCSLQCRDQTPTPGAGQQQSWIPTLGTVGRPKTDPTVKCVRPSPDQVHAICAKDDLDRLCADALDAVVISGHRGDFSDLMGVYTCRSENPRVGGGKVYTCTHNDDIHLYQSQGVAWYVGYTACMRVGKNTGYIYAPNSTRNLLESGKGWETITNTSMAWRPDTRIRVREATDEEREDATVRAAEIATAAAATRAVVLLAKAGVDLHGKEYMTGVYVRDEATERNRERVGGGTVRERGHVYEKLEQRPSLDGKITDHIDDEKIRMMETALADLELAAMFPPETRRNMKNLVDIARGRKSEPDKGDGRTFLYRSERGNGWMCSDTSDMMLPVGKGNPEEGYLQTYSTFTSEVGMKINRFLWQEGGIGCKAFETVEEAQTFWELQPPYTVPPPPTFEQAKANSRRSRNPNVNPHW